MLEKMKEMLAEQLNCEASTITPETSFKEDLNTVGDVIDYLKNKGVEA